MKTSFLLTMILTLVLSFAGVDLVSAQDNGITITGPKLFDARELQQMLQAAENQLARLNAIQAEKINAAVGQVQGGESRSTALALSATELPVRGTDSTGADGPSPTVPTPPDQSALLALTATYGLSARDLLAEQMQLTYQIINLRLLLNQALSDRLDIARTENQLAAISTVCEAREKKEEAREACRKSELLALPRQPVLLGFQVHLDPSARQRKAVAEVEVTLTLDQSLEKESLIRDLPAGSHGLGQRLVEIEPRLGISALFPAKDTFNVASIEKKAKNFGLGAIAGVVNLGVAGSKKAETFYLVKDIDTLAFETRTDSTSEVVFGWQFRPVLGSQVVEPGFRQVMALVNLNDFGENDLQRLRVEVMTRWRKIQRMSNRKKRTVGEVISGSLQPVINSVFSIPSAKALEEILKPSFKKVELHNAGGGKLLLSVEGQNFAPGTTVLMNGRPLDDAANLRITGDNRMSFLVPASDLAKGQPVVVASRYGILQPLLSQEPPIYARVSKKASTTTVDDQTAQININGLCLPDSKPVILVEVGGKTFDTATGTARYSDKDLIQECSKYEGLKVSRVVVDVPRSLAAEATRVTVRLPFHSEVGRPHKSVSDEIKIRRGDTFWVSSFSPLGPGKTDKSKTLYAIEGINLKTCFFKIKLGSNLISFDQEVSKCPAGNTEENRLTFEIDPETLAPVKKLILQQGEETQLLSTTPPPPPGPSDLKLASVHVFKDDSVELEVTGQNLGAIEEIRFEDKKLETRIEKGKFFVAITQAITAKTGTRQLTVQGKDKSLAKLQFEVKDRPATPATTPAAAGR